MSANYMKNGIPNMNKENFFNKKSDRMNQDELINLILAYQRITDFLPNDITEYFNEEELELFEKFQDLE